MIGKSKRCIHACTRHSTAHTRILSVANSRRFQISLDKPEPPSYTTGSQMKGERYLVLETVCGMPMWKEQQSCPTHCLERPYSTLCDLQLSMYPSMGLWKDSGPLFATVWQCPWQSSRKFSHASLCRDRCQHQSPHTFCRSQAVDPVLLEEVCPCWRALPAARLFLVVWPPTGSRRKTFSKRPSPHHAEQCFVCHTIVP